MVKRVKAIVNIVKRFANIAKRVAKVAKRVKVKEAPEEVHKAKVMMVKVSPASLAAVLTTTI